MAKNASADTNKNKQTEKEKAKAIGEVDKNKTGKETKETNKKLNSSEEMTGGRGGGSGRGRGSADATRKRKSKDEFDQKYEKNIANVYTVWDKDKDLVKPTKYWNGLLKADKTAAEPYTLDDLMGEGDDTIHGRCRIADKKKPIKTGELHSVEFWMVLFNGAFDTKGSSYNEPSSPKLRQFAIRLCKTNPKLIFDKYVWEGNTIKSRQDTIAWVASRKFLGDV
jgi:hypothetical protein